MGLGDEGGERDGERGINGEREEGRCEGGRERDVERGIAGK